MALKIKIRADQVVEQADGNVKWISDSGSLNNNAEAEVEIMDVAASAAAVLDPPKKAPAKKAAPPPKAAKPAPAPAVQVNASKKPPKAAQPAPSQAKTKEKIVAKAKAKSKSNGNGALRTIGGKEVDLSKYEKVKTASGGTSLDIGDATAKKLRGKTLDEVYTIVAKDTKQDAKALRAKYKNLNPGMQRMALGNMHRKGPREEKKAA